MIYIGIDTGTNTGVAVWDTASRRLLSLDCVEILQAIDIVRAFAHQGRESLFVRFEDARQRQWIPKERDMRQVVGRAKGAGSVERDCNIWEEFLTRERIRYEAVAPRYNVTKMSAQEFKAITKWPARTNEHERDAAMLVYGLTGRR